jgi:two-component system cell cycle response regulator DivK
MLVKRILMAENFDFDEADSAEEGIQKALQNPPDIILMDISMPNVDGLTATKRIRAIPELDRVPIIAVTANVMRGDREASLRAGCDGYIPKPIDIDRFPGQIMEYLQIGR